MMKDPWKLQNKVKKLFLPSNGATKFSILRKTALTLKISKIHIKYTIFWQTEKNGNQKGFLFSEAHRNGALFGIG